jgi:hypothetical protein
MPVPLVAGVLALAAMPAVVTAARGGEELGSAVVAAGVVAGAVAAFAVQEPAGAIASACPVSSISRLALRLGALASAALLIAPLVVAVASAADADATADRSARLAEFAATSGLALGAAATAARRGAEAAAIGGACFGPLCVLTATALSYRFEWLPALGVAADAARWWLVAAIAWTVALWASRDPYR